MAQNPRQALESNLHGEVLRPTAAPTWAESLQRVLTGVLILACVGVIAACFPENTRPQQDGIAAAEEVDESLETRRRRATMTRLYERRLTRASR